MDDEYMSFEEEEDDYCCSSDDHDDEEYNNAEESVLQQPREPTSQVITKEALVAAQKEVMVRVMELLSVKENQARTLLIHYQWNVDKLFSVYIDQGKDLLFSCAVEEEEEEEEGEDEEEEEEGEEGGGGDEEEEEGKKNDEVQLVSPELAEKFDRFLVESYVEDNNMVKWCPSTPHCGNAIRKIKDDSDDEVECSCGLQFCFSCLSESHSPCSCLMWKLWKKKCVDESETVNWMTVNTKLCPKCSKPIQKRDGCNHMTCKCGQFFCWLCGQATGAEHSFRSIAGHSCGRYKDEKVRQMERAKRDLDRYTHYHYRYKVHTDSLKLEDKLRKSILKKALLNSETKDQEEFKEYSWVTDAVNRLFRSRRILSYSYPFAFYMFGEELFKDEMSDEERDIKKNLFEDQQQQLEGNIEKLSKILEEPFDEYGHEEVIIMKSQLIKMCAMVDTLCKKMYECIENDLLGPLESGIHNIAPYRSMGIEQAAKFSASSACSSSGSSSN
ncbi:putative E3 ubiquitin-protein ligase ARI4 [Arabidopsis lyrata subsp. lyrata]|uniref:putative E3 ubiquitin-protein ligase ARI4 n=1 Tax=Arabidopsis lyrata subsp. lyrata TaxID=81972 RepID=UPI000A29C8C8|nr:putative E3 ubiquitin-protein ligase ARI4 [Arabidopsis lyrata subsp. lyrata]|eukprot:XP_020881926.1 putative E3 ubiquitin-protein ligase ARI4 [Arabidopsis lyrata subsp. lyrata]